MRPSTDERQAKRNRRALWVASLVLLVPVAVVLGILGWVMVPHLGEISISFWLLFAPGLAVWVAGMALSVRWHERARLLLALRVQIVGTILLFVAPALAMTWDILTGESDPVAWVAVLMLIGFAGLQVVVLTSLSADETLKYGPRPPIS